MNFQCESCGEGHLMSQCEALDGHFGFICSACAHRTIIGPMPTYTGVTNTQDQDTVRDSTSKTVPSPTDTPVGERASHPSRDYCPKCRQPWVRLATSCTRCGLVLANASPEMLENWADPLTNHALADTLRQRWRQLANAMDDVTGHQSFIALCAANGLLTYAGHCYRQILDADPENQRAEEYRQQVIQAALAHAGHLDRKVDQAVKSRLRGLVTLGIGALILLAFAIGYYFISRTQTAWQFNG